MEWDDWKPIYYTIVDRLHLDPLQDMKATELLTEILDPIRPQPLLQSLERVIVGQSIVICGAGPSLNRHIQKLMDDKKTKNAIYIAADGAVSVLLENGCYCSIVVTDLDSNLKYLYEAKEQGALTIVQGHGDNISKIQEIVPSLGAVLGSTQVKPTNRAFLWGGFTDGDRACHIAATYAPRELILAGMDFGDIVGKWSKPNHEDHFPASERKRLKLEIAESLIESLLNQRDMPYTVLG